MGGVYYAYGAYKNSLELTILAKIKLSQKKILFTSLIVVIIGAVAALGWYLWAGVDSSVDDTPVTLDEALVAGMEYGDKGDIEGGLAYYDSQIERHKDSPEEQQLLLYKSSFALNADRHDEALESAKRADEIDSNTTTVAALAQVYRENGDNEAAIELYKKLIAAAPGDGGMGDRDRHEWELIVKELEG